MLKKLWVYLKRKSQHQTCIWLTDGALEMLRSSPLWSSERLEVRLSVKTAERGETAFETDRDLAMELLKWYKFHYFELWRQSGAKGDPFDVIDLTGTDQAKEMEMVTCRMAIMSIEAALGTHSPPKFGEGEIGIKLPPNR